MAFNCDLYYYSNGYTDKYGCDASTGGWYNSYYGNCCSRFWTAFGAWMMGITITIIILVCLAACRRARMQRRMAMAQAIISQQQYQQPIVVVQQQPGNFAG